MVRFLNPGNELFKESINLGAVILRKKIIKDIFLIQMRRQV